MNHSDTNLRGADFTNVDLGDARLDGMTIDGILVTDLLRSVRDGKTG